MISMIDRRKWIRLPNRRLNYLRRQKTSFQWLCVRWSSRSMNMKWRGEVVRYQKCKKEVTKREVIMSGSSGSIRQRDNIPRAISLGSASNNSLDRISSTACVDRPRKWKRATAYAKIFSHRCLSTSASVKVQTADSEVGNSLTTCIAAGITFLSHNARSEWFNFDNHRVQFWYRSMSEHCRLLLAFIRGS